MTRGFSLILVGLLLLFALAFSIQNAQQITIDFFVGSYRLPLSVVVISSLISGFVLGLIGMMSPFLKLKFENARLRKDIRAKERVDSPQKNTSNIGNSQSE